MATTAVTGSTASTASTSTASTSTASTSSTATGTAAQIAAANKASAQALISSLGAGSGVDVTALAQNLVNAEKVPQENAINAKITANDNRVSGYSAVMYMLDQVNTALADLKDTSDYNSLAVSGASSSYTLTPSTSAKEGDHTIQVNSIYKAQKTISSTAFTDTTTAGQVGAGPFSITQGGTTTQIDPGNGSPQALVDAINAKGIGITASLVNTGSGYKLVMTGTAGAGNAFTLNDGTGGPLGMTNLQEATDAAVTVDGIAYTRKTNTLTDVISGTTMTLRSPTASQSNGTASTDYVSFSRDTTTLKTKFTALVTAYNDAQSLLTEVSNPKSTLADYGGTLVGDSTVRLVQSKLRGMFSNKSSTPGTNVQYMWQMGFSFDAKGVMSLDSTKLSDALTNHYDDVVTAVTGNKDNLSKYSPAAAGLFGDATYKINQLISATGPIATQSQNATQQNTKYQDQLTKLDTRMTMLLDRYTKQFAAMQSIVGNANSQKTSLKSSFDGMMAMYTNKA
jgi:flagellar hook-associated protein 2